MLHIEEFGSGVPVVLLHGTPVDPRHFLPLAERLSSRYRALLVHLPGYGQSANAAPETLEQSQRLLVESLRQHNVEDAHVVGFSTGAYRAFFLAARRQLHVRSIIGLGAVAQFSHRSDELRMQAGLIREGAIDVRQYCEDVCMSARARGNPVWREHVRSWADAISLAQLAREAEALADAPDLLGELGSLDLPVLLRVGALDVGAPPATSREIAASLPRCTLEIVPEVGHALLTEDFEASAASLERFLSSVS